MRMLAKCVPMRLLAKCVCKCVCRCECCLIVCVCVFCVCVRARTWAGGGGMCTAQNIFFGDVLFVSGMPVEPVVNTKCVNKDCGIKLVANRETMRVEGLLFLRSLFLARPLPF